jgi:hypothetical protein
MADIFNFGGFLKKVNKDREEKAMPAEPTQKLSPP